MTSLVIELQRQALDAQSRITDILRTALVVSKKLGVHDFTAWIQTELGGYEAGTEVPAYRKVRGRLMARNPYHGWIPVILEDSKLAGHLSARDIGQPISQIEALCTDKEEDGLLAVPLPHEWLMKVFGNSEEFRLGMIPTLLVDHAQLKGVLDSVRNEVLNWSLELEKKGIVGEGMTFSTEEIQRAGSTTYNIQNFKGVLGNVSGSSVQVGDYASLHQQLKNRGVSQTERNELENILDGLRTARAGEKDGVFRKGLDWLKRNATTIGTLSETIRTWFESLS